MKKISGEFQQGGNIKMFILQIYKQNKIINLYLVLIIIHLSEYV